MKMEDTELVLSFGSDRDIVTLVFKGSDTPILRYWLPVNKRHSISDTPNPHKIHTIMYNTAVRLGLL